MAYVPQPGSLADRVCSYFRSHYMEELTQGDIARIFSVPSASITPCLAAPLQHKLLARRRDAEDGTMLWIAGAELKTASMTEPARASANAQAPASQPAAAPTPAPAAAAIRRAGRGAMLPPLELSRLTVKTGKPPAIQRGGPNNVSRYDELFGSLAEPDTFVEVPANYRGALSKAATVWCKRNPGRKLVVRKIDEARAGVFRTA